MKPYLFLYKTVEQILILYSNYYGNNTIFF